MKASPNREQLLFLAAGGVILVVILVVVLFNVLRVPKQVVQENITPRPMVAVQTPENDKKSDGAPNESAWVTKRMAPVFDEANHRKTLSTDGRTEEEVFRKPETAPTSQAQENTPAVEVKTNKVVLPGGKPGEVPMLPVIPAIGKELVKPMEKNAPVVPKPTTKEVTKEASKEATKETKENKEIKEAKDPIKAAIAAQIKEATKPLAPAPTAKETGKPAPVAAAPGKGNFAVSLGSFSDDKNAGGLQQRIATLNLPAYVQKTTVNGKPFFRVRAGPFANREEANEASRIVRDKAGISGTVVVYGE